MRTTVLGMGRMGQALAARLLDTGHEVTVWNRTPGRADELVARGAHEARDAPGAAAGAEAVMSVLTDDAAVTEVLLPGGSPLSGGATFVECSTVAPATTRELAGAYGGRLVASPVLGAPAAVAAGEAALAVAGPAGAVARVRPVLDSVSGHIRLCGEDPGAALVVKLINNYLLLSGLAAVSEAAALGQAAGLGDDQLVDLLQAVAAPMLRNRVADVVSGDHDGWFPTPMGAKDVRLFIGLGREHGVGLPVAATVASRYEEAAATGLEDRDIAAVVELLRRPA